MDKETMNQPLYDLIVRMLDEKLIKGTLSSPKQKNFQYVKTVVQLIDERKAFYQFESFTNEQAFHRNVDIAEAATALYEIALEYKQLHMQTESHERTIRLSKKGKLHINEKNQNKMIEARTHNVKKKHLLPEGIPVDFLIHLGIMEKSGKVKHKWYDKFRQINRYLEFIEDSLKYIDTQQPTIVDFGCGKSYLTFALYYYLVKIKRMKVNIIGLDLKEKVIQNLNALTKELGYKGLSFKVGDIAMFEYDKPIDMVISLHACNLATDYALEKAVQWKAKVIMAVPCCHKEANGQINIEPMKAVMKHGILKERIAALMTDGLRAELLEAMGYETTVMEFVDMEHTPKNLMIRGVLSHAPADGPSEAFTSCTNEYGLDLTLYQLLFKDK